MAGGAAAAWPLVARAQQGERMRGIGVLVALPEDDANMKSRLAALRQGLERRGWSDGRNIRIDYASCPQAIMCSPAEGIHLVDGNALQLGIGDLSTKIDRFNLAALYFLGRAYDEHPIPVTVQRADILNAIAPMPGEDEESEREDRKNASFEVGYTFNFLVENDYLKAMDTLNAGGWRVVLKDKGLLALKKPTLADPSETLGDRAKKWVTEIAGAGLKEVGKKAGAELIDQILNAGSWVQSTASG
jgi:hypothetical protein